MWNSCSLFILVQFTLKVIIDAGNILAAYVALRGRPQHGVHKEARELVGTFLPTVTEVSPNFAHVEHNFIGSDRMSRAVVL